MKKLPIDLQKAFYLAKYGEGWEEKEFKKNCMVMYGAVFGEYISKTREMEKRHDIKLEKIETAHRLEKCCLEILGRPIEATLLLAVLSCDYYIYYLGGIYELKFLPNNSETSQNNFTKYIGDKVCNWKPNTPAHLQEEKDLKILLKLITKK